MQDELNITLIEEDTLNINLNEEDNFQVSIENDVINVASNDYKKLKNKPQINSVELIDNKTLDELNIQVKGNYPDEALTNSDIEELLNNFA